MISLTTVNGASNVWLIGKGSLRTAVGPFLDFRRRFAVRKPIFEGIPQIEEALRLSRKNVSTRHQFQVRLVKPSPLPKVLKIRCLDRINGHMSEIALAREVHSGKQGT